MATHLMADITDYEIRHFNDGIGLPDELLEEEEKQTHDKDLTEDSLGHCIRDKSGAPLLRIAYQ